MCATAASTRRASCAPSHRNRRHRRARARPHRQQHLLRRRHAVADAAGLGGRDPRRHRQTLDASRPTLRSRSKPIRPAWRPTRFRGYRAAGVNRVSLGVQALDDAALKELGRLHTAQEALDAVAIARANFERYSFDLIYARPRPDARILGGRIAARARASGRSSLALSTHHRAGHAVLRPAQSRQAHHPRRRLGARSLRPHAGDLRRRRPAGLRDFQPRAAGRRVPAQSGLLARPRICRHRAGRAWPPHHRRPPHRDRNREAPGKLADARRGAGTASSSTKSSRPARRPTNSC